MLAVVPPVWSMLRVEEFDFWACNYSGACTGVQQLTPGEGAILEVTTWSSLLLFCTQGGGVHAWDPRSGSDAWQLPYAPQEVCAYFQNFSGCPGDILVPDTHLFVSLCFVAEPCCCLRPASCPRAKYGAHGEKWYC